MATPHSSRCSGPRSWSLFYVFSLLHLQPTHSKFCQAYSQKMCIFNPFHCYHHASNNNHLFPQVSPHCPNSGFCFHFCHHTQHRWPLNDVLGHVVLLVKFCIGFQFIQVKAEVFIIFAVAPKDIVGWASMTSLTFSLVSLLTSPRSCQACSHLRVFVPSWKFHICPLHMLHFFPLYPWSKNTIIVRPSLTNH